MLLLLLLCSRRLAVVVVRVPLLRLAVLLVLCGEWVERTAGADGAEGVLPLGRPLGGPGELPTSVQVVVVVVAEWTRVGDAAVVGLVDPVAVCLGEEEVDEECRHSSGGELSKKEVVSIVWTR